MTSLDISFNGLYEQSSKDVRWLGVEICGTCPLAAVVLRVSDVECFNIRSRD
jgi:hypothetical protein